MPFLIAYPETLIEYATLEEAYSNALALAHNMGKTVGVYEVILVRAVDDSPVPPPAMPPRVA